MNYTKHTIKQTMLATAVATALGTATYSGQSTAAPTPPLTFSVTGLFTMINSTGAGALNNSDVGGAPWYGFRTPVFGTMTFFPDTHTGTMTLDPFSFFGGGSATATGISFVDTDGMAGAGTELLSNMGFTWNGSVGIPVSLTWNADGLLDAIDMGLTVGDTIGPDGSTFECTGTGTDIDITCALAATDGFDFDFGSLGTYNLPIGQVPLATTTFNTTTIGGATCTLGCSPSGTLPLSDDGVGGNPMVAGPFPGFNANFDFTDFTLDSDGTGSITAPDDLTPTVPETPGPDKTLDLNLGLPTDLTPAGTAVAEYCLEDLAATCDMNDSWIPDNASVLNPNPITLDITQQTVTTKDIPWRSAVADEGLAFDTQKVTATVDDTTDPVIDSMPADIMPDVDSTPAEVCFTNDGIGHLTASDVWTATPTIEWSLDGFFPGNANDPVENCTSDFGPNANTVYWQVSDDAGNTSDYEQTVTLVLPDGIVGTDCVFDIPTQADRAICEADLGDPDCPVDSLDEFDRDIVARFIMRNAGGSQIGITDTTITGRMDTTLLCDDLGEDACTLDGAAWETTQPFEGLLWKATPVRLFGEDEIEPSWTFETCPGDDASINCPAGAPIPPTPLSMTSVGPGADSDTDTAGQLSAHMLFEWGSTEDIDVVVVWDVDCGTYMLTATDPDGDGVIGSRMVDGPFQGFNAAFDISTADGEPFFTDGGFTTEFATFQNPIPGGSPPLLDVTEMDAGDFPNDPAAIASCVGGCPDFRVTDPNLMMATDAGGTYKFTRIVWPLSEDIPFWSLLRKFKDGEWSDWVTDDRNTVKTAPKTGGSCPEPGSGDYSVASFNSRLANKLEFADGCLELTIEDNGPNDIDPTPGEIQDPPGVAAVPTPGLPSASTSGSSGGTGGCSLSTAAIDPAKRADWTLMGGVLALLGFFSLRRRRNQKH